VWNGASWSITADAAAASTVDGVSCPTKQFCGAFGPNYSEFRTRGTWSAAPLKHLPAKAALTDLSCVASQHCILTGHTTSYTLHTPFALRWDGTSWQKMPAPPLPDDQAVSGIPQEVSCISDTFCVVAGTAYLGPGTQDPDPLPLLDLWDGTNWTAEQLP
jgi:hypothetical protein